MSNYICPLLQTTMTDPVIAQDGHTYERSAITEWLNENGTSPMTREKISNALLTNHTLRSQMANAGYQLVGVSPNTTLETKHTNSLKARNGPGVNITLVLDVSGSMDMSVQKVNIGEPSFSRLDLIKHAVLSISEMMSEQDFLSIVTFSSTANVVLPRTKIGENVVERVKLLVEKLHTEGTTDIPAGVKLGASLKPDHLILLTDGANTNTPMKGSLSEYIMSLIPDFSGHIHSVGLGMADDLDTPTLRAVSSHTGGQYYYCPDGSMVGTVFIHLMANICINEQGQPFPQYDHFVSLLIEVMKTHNLQLLYDTKFDDPILNEDLVSTEPNKGQVEKAIKNWDTWGRHYLPSFIDAHIHRRASNFKDSSLQLYKTKQVTNFIESGEVIFLTIEPPVPSCNNYQNQHVTRGGFASSTMNIMGACFSGDTDLFCKNGEYIGRIKIKDVRKGQLVKTLNGYSKVLCLVVSPESEMVYISQMMSFISHENIINTGFWVSKKHPIMMRGSKGSYVWKHAEEYAAENSGDYSVETKLCYNLVLEDCHIIQTNIACYSVTLGHNLKGPCVEHDYLGSDRVINDLKQINGWDEGRVHVVFDRDDNGINRLYTWDTYEMDYEM